jgi:hypothetical protein
MDFAVERFPSENDRSSSPFSCCPQPLFDDSQLIATMDGRSYKILVRRSDKLCHFPGDRPQVYGKPSLQSLLKHNKTLTFLSARPIRVVRPVRPESFSMSAVSMEPIQASAAIRRSGRVSKEIPIVFSGADAAGRAFCEQTKTLVLSLHGASVICHQKLIPEQEAYLRVMSNNREIEVRICGQIGERQDGYIYGVAFADPDVNFWRIEFPPAEALPQGLIPVTLECSGCRRQIDLQFDATEMDVYTVNEGALRYCSQCAVSTLWRIAAERIIPKVRTPGPKVESAVPQIAELPAQIEAQVATESIAEPVSFPPRQNRRSERRMRVKFNACIRVSGWSDEVVLCEDMSRGGFSFHSGREYAVETLLEAAVPYTQGAMSIFVPGQIANVTPLQNGKLFRYGVAYIRSPKR